MKVVKKLIKSWIFHIFFLFLLIVPILLVNIYLVEDPSTSLWSFQRFGGIVTIYGIILGIYGINVEVFESDRSNRTAIRKVHIERFKETISLDKNNGLPKLQIAILASLIGTLIRSYGDLFVQALKN